MRCGLIARADAGGLAQMTVEFARHMNPARVVIVDLGDSGRGPMNLDRLAFLNPWQMMVTSNPIGDDPWEWLLDGSDVLYTAETAYRPGWCDQAAGRGVATILHAMPELYAGDEPDSLVVPTTWERQRLPWATRLGVPVATDLFPFSQRTEARRFLCAPGPAFHDRDGLNIIIEALPHVREECTILLRTSQPEETGRRLERFGLPPNVTIELHRPWPRYDQLPDFDALLLPRRYGGLSLPMQEAAALGRPTLTLTREPNRGFLSRPLQAQGHIDHQATMKGGRFDVWDVDPRHYAAIIDNTIRRPDLFTEASTRCGEWAETSSWQARAGEYHHLVEATVEGAHG